LRPQVNRAQEMAKKHNLWQIDTPII